MASLSCPLCSASLPSSQLEAHLRSELAYTPLRCLRCPFRFFARAAALAHFSGPFPAHPAEEVALAEERDARVEQRLQQLLEEAGLGRSCRSACGCCDRLKRLEAEGSRVDETLHVLDGGPEGAGEAAQLCQVDDSAPASPEAVQAPAPPSPPLRPEWASQPSTRREAEASILRAIQTSEDMSQEEPAELSSLQDIKPELNSSVWDAEGRLPCLLCGHRVDRSNLYNHAQRKHLELLGFRCELCHHQTRRKDVLREHVLNVHKVPPTVETMSSLDLRALTQAKLGECFGSVSLSEAPKAAADCRACGVSVPLDRRKDHAAAKHLRQTLHACRLCPFQSQAWRTHDLFKHMRRQHRVPPSEHNSLSYTKEMLPEIKRILPTLFALFDYIWSTKQGLSDEDALGILPDKLQAEIATHVHFDTLRKVRIFQDTEAGLLAELVLKLRLQIFSPSDYVCRKGDIGREMYIVKRGRIAVVSEDGKKVFVTLAEGAVFGELSIMNIPGNKQGNRRSASVRSVGYSDLFALSKDDLWEALREYPEAKRILMAKGREILAKDGLLEEGAPESAETTDEKAEKLDALSETLTTRLARLMATSLNERRKAEDRIMALEAQIEDLKAKASAKATSPTFTKRTPPSRSKQN